jgi:hypothetical protein
MMIDCWPKCTPAQTSGLTIGPQVANVANLPHTQSRGTPLYFSQPNQQLAGNARQFSPGPALSFSQEDKIANGSRTTNRSQSPER